MKESFYKGSIGSLKEFWEDRGRTGSFERGYHTRLEGISSIVRRVARFIDGKRVLDIGCGPGVVASLFPRNTEVVGSDFSVSMLRSAKDRIQQLIRGNAFNLPFRNGVFEVATCFFVASDYSSKDGIFSEACRILAKGGLFLFADYSPDDEHWILKRRIRRLLGESCDIFIEGAESLRTRLERSSFKVQETESIGFNQRFELGWYTRSEKESAQLEKTDPRLWKHIQHLMKGKKIGREFTLLISRKNTDSG